MLAWIETHSELAAWVQAIGSLLTLWLAIELPARQRRAAQREAETVLFPILEQAVKEIEQTTWALNILVKGSPLPEGDFRSDCAQRVRRTISRLTNFPCQTIRYRAVAPLLGFVHACEEFEEAALEVLRDFGTDKQRSAMIYWFGCQTAVESAYQNLVELRKLLPHSASRADGQLMELLKKLNLQ